MASHVILPLGTENAPADAVVPNAGDWPLQSVFAHFDGTSATGAWVPVLQILSSAGATVAEIPMDAPVAAGASVEATWAPFLRSGGSVVGTGLALLYSNVLAVDAASVAITGIPQTHTHIELYSLARTDRAAGSDLIALQFNGDTSAAYDWEQLFGNNGVADAFNAPTGGHIAGPITTISLTSATAATATAGSFGSGRWTVLYYTQTTTHKMVVGQGGVFVDDSAAGAVRAGMAGVWRNTAAITSMTLAPQLGTVFKAGSRFELYGI